MHSICFGAVPGAFVSGRDILAPAETLWLAPRPSRGDCVLGATSFRSVSARRPRPKPAGGWQTGPIGAVGLASRGCAVQFLRSGAKSGVQAPRRRAADRGVAGRNGRAVCRARKQWWADQLWRSHARCCAGARRSRRRIASARFTRPICLIGSIRSTNTVYLSSTLTTGPSLPFTAPSLTPADTGCESAQARVCGPQSPAAATRCARQSRRNPSQSRTHPGPRLNPRLR